MDRNLAKSSSNLIRMGYRGAANVSKPRPGSARRDDFRRIEMIGGTQSNFGLRLRPCFASALDGMRTRNFCRSAILGGGRNRRSGVITHRGTDGGFRSINVQNGTKALTAEKILTSKINIGPSTEL